MMRKILLMLTCLIALTGFKTKAQQTATAHVLISGHSAVIVSAPAKNTNAVRIISRSVGNKQNYIQLAVLRRAASLTDFREMVGDTLMQGLKRLKKISSDNDLWKYINTDPPFSDFSLAMFNLRFLSAMGLAYVDNTISTLPENTRVYYKITAPSGAVDTGSLVTGKQPNAIKPTLVYAMANDTTALIKWGIKAPEKMSFMLLPHYADVYQKNQAGVFEEKAFKIYPSVVKDSLCFLLLKKVKPGMEYTFYIQPVDIYANAIAVHSDTVSLMSVNLQKMMPVEKATAKDSTVGILLKWKKITANPLYSGVLIQRAEKVNGVFSAVGVVPLTDSSYLDKNVMAGQMYFYRMKVTSQKQKYSSNFSAFVSSAHLDKFTRPDAPYGVNVITNKDGVIISWQAVKSSQALAGYRVYRSDRLDTTQMEAVSRLIPGTSFIDTTKNRSRRTMYTYAVKAMSIGGVESRYSSTFKVKLSTGRDVPLIPAFIYAVRKGNTITIQWQNTRMDDNYISGYNIFRKKIVPGEQLNYDLKKSGAAEAARIGFVKLNKKAVDKPYYIDTLTDHTGQYEYVVSATDVIAGESGLTALASDNSFKEQISSPKQLVLSNMNNQIQLKWQQPDLNGVTGYNLYRKTVGESGFKRIANINTTQTVYSDPAILQHHTYVYQVRSVGNGGESAGYASQLLRVD